MGAVFGHAVGDALGVPVEFRGREALRADPVKGMRGQGTHGQLPGTWSDDTSLMLCLLVGLGHEIDLQGVAGRFIRWRDESYLTPHGEVFDIGSTTREAIARLRRGTPHEEAGGGGEPDNGNGSLMRILPVAFLSHLSDREAAAAAHAVSCLTHRHPRSQMACGLFVLLCRRLLDGMERNNAYEAAVEAGRRIYAGWAPYDGQVEHFVRFMSGNLGALREEDINSGGYVIHTLEAATWCLLNNGSFAETVLAAVNLGEDTDTTGAVVGGLAGAAYGYASIPAAWLSVLARPEKIEEIVDAFLESR
jgi:ADP-ribosylglycohydrolase